MTEQPNRVPKQRERVTCFHEVIIYLDYFYTISQKPQHKELSLGSCDDSAFTLYIARMSLKM